MFSKWQERLHWINKCNSPLAPQWPQITSVHKHQPFINWTSLQKWGKVIHVGNLINRLPMNTHSYKVNKYEPFKTHQEKFLETFQMKIQWNTHSKRGCTASINVSLLLDSCWFSAELVKCKKGLGPCAQSEWPSLFPPLLQPLYLLWSRTKGIVHLY